MTEKLYTPGNVENTDPQPMEMPAGFKKPETMEEMVQRLVRREVSEAAEMRGDETFEESEDFEIDEDSFPSSPFEEVFDPVLQRGITLDEFRLNQELYRQRYEDAHDKAYRQLELSDALRRRRTPPAEQSGPKAGQQVSQPTPSETAAKQD